jgi:hypothetical protein
VSAYCQSCQQLVCNADFTVNAISKLEDQLGDIKNEIKDTLLRNYKGILREHNLTQPDPNEKSIQDVIVALGIKVEAKEELEEEDVEEAEEFIFPVIRSHQLTQLKKRQTAEIDSKKNPRPSSSKSKSKKRGLESSVSAPPVNPEVTPTRKNLRSKKQRLDPVLPTQVPISSGRMRKRSSSGGSLTRY